MEVPSQTPFFHSLHKERYARQELIREIEKHTGRTLVVYVANLSHPGGMINRNDILPFGDLLEGKEDVDLDLMLQSPGGDIDKEVRRCERPLKNWKERLCQRLSEDFECNKVVFWEL